MHAATAPADQLHPTLQWLALGAGHVLSAAGKLGLILAGLLGFFLLATPAVHRSVLLGLSGWAVAVPLVVILAVAGATVAWRHPRARLGLAWGVGVLGTATLLLALATVVLHPVFPFYSSYGVLALGDADKQDLLARMGIAPGWLFVGAGGCAALGLVLRRNVAPPAALPSSTDDRAYARTLLGLFLLLLVVRVGLPGYVRMFEEVGVVLPRLAQAVYDLRGWFGPSLALLLAGSGFVGLMLGRRYQAARYAGVALSALVCAAATVATLALVASTLRLYVLI